MMSGTKTRKVYEADSKAKVALETVRESRTLDEPGQEFGVHPVQISQWKKDWLQRASELFESKRGPQPVAEHRDPERLYGEIGRLKMELDELKKSRG
jgi:transposase-like protein